jgi:hypothetical protein
VQGKGDMGHRKHVTGSEGTSKQGPSSDLPAAELQVILEKPMGAISCKMLAEEFCH